ncbi:hypothetical protein DL765_005766 [Monosporascus sp. GIB2]|nr:hypothetical protein DL765_005766 [Monosporascus sp. GIB2]
MQNQPYLQAGIAVVEFDYTAVAPDRNAKTGAFWALYNGRDIAPHTRDRRRPDGLGLGLPPHAGRAERDGGGDRRGAGGGGGVLAAGQGGPGAGLFDPWIALTMPMSSGVQGLGPYRYASLSGQGETLENSKSGAPWWSSSGLGRFVDHASSLPFDAHTIAAALAPRALVIDQGTADPFVNSKGTSVVVYPAAKRVYEWLGVGDRIGISVRGGGHCDLSGFTSVLPFVQKILLNQTISKNYDNLGSYGSPMTAAFPWVTATPKVPSGWWTIQRT